MTIATRRPTIPAYREGAMEITRLADKYVSALEERGSPTTTRDEYRRIYKQFMIYVGGRGLADDLRHFTAEVCEGFIAYLAGRGAKPATIRHKLSALSSLAVFITHQRDARQRPILSTNPVKMFPWPKRQRPKQEFLYPDELRAFLEVPCPTHEAVARDLFVDTGLRVSELCRANVEDWVQIAGAWLLYVPVKGAGRQEERVPCPVSTPVAAFIAEYLAKRPVPLSRGRGKEALLLTRVGQRWKRAALGQCITRIGDKAGITRIRVSPHKLRRTSNVVARYADVESYTRSRLLNHTDPGTIREYDAVIPGELSEAREKSRRVGLPRYLGGAGL